MRFGISYAHVHVVFSLWVDSLLFARIVMKDIDYLIDISLCTLYTHIILSHSYFVIRLFLFWNGFDISTDIPEY